MMAPSPSSPMADSDAVIVKFSDEANSFCVWVWPHPNGPGSHPTCEVSVRKGEAWIPIQLDGGKVQAVEVQGGLL